MLASKLNPLHYPDFSEPDVGCHFLEAELGPGSCVELEFLIQSRSEAGHCLNAAHSVHSRGSKLTPVNCSLSTNFQAGGIFFFSCFEFL